MAGGLIRLILSKLAKKNKSKSEGKAFEKELVNALSPESIAKETGYCDEKK